MAGRRPLLTTSRGINREAFSTVDWLLFATLSGVWGASFLFIDIGLEAFHPGVVTLLRAGFGAATVALVPQVRAPINREDWPRVLVLAVIWIAIPLTIFPLAQQWIDSAVAGMLNGTMPLFTALVAAAMLRELPGRRQTAGLVVGFIGLVLVALPSAGSSPTALLGVVLVVVATVCYAVATNIVTPLQQRYGSLPVLGRVQMVAAVLVVPFGLSGLTASTFAWPSFWAVAAVGVLGTGLAFVLMGSLSGRVGATRASFITYVIPVVALVLGVVFLQERVAALAVAGVVLVIAGAALASRPER